MKFRFTSTAKARFYLRYFADKVFCIWFKVKSPKFVMFAYEMMYSAAKLISPKSLFSSPFKTDSVSTEFGIFRIRPGTIDMATVSPAFERPDIERLLDIIGQFIRDGRRVLFLDIGANIGTYAITVGNGFKESKRLKVIAFEPSQSLSVLMENIRLNGLEDMVETKDSPLYSISGAEVAFNYSIIAPGTSNIKTTSQNINAVRMLTTTIEETVKTRMAEFDTLVLKIDVEGMESHVLKGGRHVFDNVPEVYMLVEDFVNAEVIDYLESIGAEFMCKLTPYNSFWRLAKQSIPAP